MCEGEGFRWHSRVAEGYCGGFRIVDMHAGLSLQLGNIGEVLKIFVQRASS